ncbi:hypothetical protein B0O80DRAFT_435960 [Mortierella sp. GBAus27b]|nr:hypothetical protein B0O80DRAFT_435960 [Mortierella sp. GBAus27b]
MASIMPFPNVATHRRMPHLPNSPRQAQDQQQLPLPHPADHPLQSQGGQESTTTHQLRLDDQDGQLLLQGRLGSPRGSIALLDTEHPPKDDQLLLHGLGLAQGRPTSPLPLSASSGSLNSHDSKLIKNALYDAFGCLYHPSAHTRHSTAATAAALRSGDVTPLMGLSPKASPLLRPNLGPSAPITPLELSDESSAAGYFALHVPSSPVPNVGAPGPIPGRHHGHHHHHHSHRHSHPHTSSHLSSAYTPSLDEKDEEPLGHGQIPQASLAESVLNPTEHPVLSSLQALSLSHPHSTEHYHHRHLGHTLGHDIVPIDEAPPAILSMAAAPNANRPPVVASRPNHATTSDSAAAGPTGITPTAAATVAVTEHQPLLNSLSPQGPLQPPSSSPRSTPFPMDQNDHSSIAGFGHQGLV